MINAGIEPDLNVFFSLSNWTSSDLSTSYSNGTSGCDCYFSSISYTTVNSSWTLTLGGNTSSCNVDNLTLEMDYTADETYGLSSGSLTGIVNI